MRHTKGPWKVYDYRDLNDAIWIGVDNPHFGKLTHAEVRYVCDEAKNIGDIEANAQLIASAPELLEVCKAVIPALISGKLDDRVRAQKLVNEVVTKAQGVSHE